MNKKIEFLTKLKDLFTEYQVEIFADVNFDSKVLSTDIDIQSIDSYDTYISGTQGSSYLSIEDIENELNKEII